MQSIDPSSPKKLLPHAILLHNIRSAYNVGSIIRSCEFFGVRSLYISGHTPAPDHPKVKKTALGAEKFIEWSYQKNPLDFFPQIKKDFKIIGFETLPDAPCLSQMQIFSPTLFILGRETEGLEENLMNECQEIYHLRALGQKASLNVSNFMTLALYQAWYSSK